MRLREARFHGLVDKVQAQPLSLFAPFSVIP